MTPEYDYNAASLYKTKLFRDIRDSIVIELGIPSDEVRDIIGPIVAQHVEQATKRQQVIDIANRMLGEQTALEIPNLVAKDGVVTVARAKKKRKAKTVPQATREDASFLLELLRRAKQEHSLSLSAMAIALGVSSHTVHGWLYKEDSVPYSRNRSTIARYLRQFAYDIPARIK